ncbi:MAG: hypothetical protein ACI4PJ_01740 [Acutalibacteraceae bacterium]
MTSPEGSEVHPFECGKLDTGWKIYQVMISKNYSFLIFIDFSTVAINFALNL